MKILLHLLVTPCLAGIALAQTSPPHELGLFKPMLGHWEGGGTVRPTGADGPTVRFTTILDFREILGGHFFQEDLVVTPEGLPPIQARTYYGWDGENKRYVAFGFDSDGQAAVRTVHWAKGRLISAQTAPDPESGQVITTRRVAELVGLKRTLDIQRSIGGEADFQYAQGVLSRKERTAAQVDFAPHEGALPDALAPMGATIGQWSLAGEMSVAPGVDPVPITATETVTVTRGGAALLSHIVGQPGDYEAVSLVFPDPVRGGFRHVSADNMGGFVEAAGHVVDDTIVVTYSGTLEGAPYAERTLVVLGEQGPTKLQTHRYTGTADSVLVFEADYASSGE